MRKWSRRSTRTCFVHPLLTLVPRRLRDAEIHHALVVAAFHRLAIAEPAGGTR
jgi:hypothetical protein